MDRANIEKIAQNPGDKVLLAKIWDKMQSGIRKNVMTNTGFLSLRELDMAQYLFGNCEGLRYFGGYADAERKMLIYLPEYLNEKTLMDEDSPVVCLRATFYEGNTPTHRDFLGALIGIGISRETVGDICVGRGYCDFFITAELAAYIIQNFVSAGRTKLHIDRISLNDAQIPKPKTKEIKDTVASVRLDSIIASGFHIGRSAAAQLICAGKAAINGLPCEKPDKAVAECDKISVRGLGKIKLKNIGNQTKKGRISVVIDRYI